MCVQFLIGRAIIALAYRLIACDRVKMKERERGGGRKRDVWDKGILLRARITRGNVARVRWCDIYTIYRL